MSGKPKNVLKVGDNNTLTDVHVGDVNVPEAELYLASSNATTTQNPDGTYTTIIPAKIVAPYAPGSLLIEAWAAGIVRLEVIAQRTGLQMDGHCGVRPTYAFHTLMSPFGMYMIHVTTRDRAQVEIRHAFDV